MHRLIPKEAHLPYRRKKKSLKTNSLKKLWYWKSQFLWGTSPTQKNPPFAVFVLALGLDFISDLAGEREIHVPHKWIYSHHSAIILNAIVKPQHLSPNRSHLHSALCHISAFVILYCLLCHKNHTVTAQWNEQEEIWTSKICKHTPEMQFC